MNIPLSSAGEVADFTEADQMQAGKSQFECGFFAVAMARSMARVGQSPTLSVAQVIADAEAWYAQYDGSDDPSNMDGMTLPQLYSLLQQVGLHYQALNLDMNMVKGWLNVGYPVIIAVTETSVVDMALNANPYPWNPAGTHVIVVTGVTSDGNVLVRDSANCTDLYNPNSLRPGPRKYNAGQLGLVSATVAVPPWLPRPTSMTPPTVAPTPGVPEGWRDDGTTLTAPNGFIVTDGFRDWVLRGGWNPLNYPLENAHEQSPVEGSNPSLGNGTQQVFRQTVLEWTPKRGVFESWVGQEFLFLRQLLSALQAKITDLAAQTAALQAQVAALEAANGLPALQTVKDDLTALLAKLP